MAKLLYQGHGSYRITAGDGRILYVDPYAGDGYGNLPTLSSSPMNIMTTMPWNGLL